MQIITIDDSLFDEVNGKTAVVFGAANGIGAETVRLLDQHGAKTVIVDLQSQQSKAEELMSTLSKPSNSLFLPANMATWGDMKTVFREAIKQFGDVQIVFANAGTMEASPIFDFEQLDESGELADSIEASRVIDVNVMGAINCMRRFISHLPVSRR